MVSQPRLWKPAAAKAIISRVSKEQGKRVGLRGVLALFTLFAALHAVVLPLFEGPDEPDNLTYIRFLATEGRLTQPSVEVTHELENLSRGIVPPLWFLAMVPVFDAVGARDWEVTAPQEPDFYRRQRGVEIREALDRPASRMHFKHGADESSAFEGAGFAIRVMRWFSIPWALVALIATWLIAARVTGNPIRATWVTAMAAFLPQFQHLSGTLTMDVMLTAWGALALYACVEWCSGEGSALRWAALAGVSVALASLTKLNGLVLVPACFIAAAFAWRTGRGFTKPLLACAISFLVIAGPYYLWGWIESGHPLWTWRYQQISPYHTDNLPVATAWGLDGIAVFTMSMFLTWLADFGWTSVWFPAWIVVPFGALTAIGTAGGVIIAFGSRGHGRLAGAWVSALVMLTAIWMCLRWILLGRDQFAVAESESTAALIVTGLVLIVALVFGLGGALRRHRTRKIAGDAALPEASVALGFLICSACLILLAEVWFNLQFAQPQARHLYPFLPALIVPVALGLERVRLLRFVVLVQVVLCIAAFPMLLGRMRYEGWNSDPVIAATDLDRHVHAGLTEGSGDYAAVEWVEPEEHASFGPNEPPVLLWQIDQVSEYDVVIGLRSEMQHRPWHPDGSVFRAVTVFGKAPRGSLAVPTPFWASLVPGTSIHVQIVALGPDGTATGRSTLREFRRSE